ALRKCILSGPYKPTTVLVQEVAATDDSSAIHEHTTDETPMNMSPKNKAHFQAEKEAIHLILTEIGDEIYSTVDACQKAQEMWEAIERFVMIVKQKHKLDEVSYHKLFDILKQYQKEVNELRVERLARNANPLALVATAQANQDPYYQTSKSHKSYAPSSKLSIPTRSHTTTRHRGKEIAKPITPPSKIAFKDDNDPEQAQRDKDMQKNLALIAKENVGSPVVQQSGIHCFNCKEFGHFAKECRKPKRVKDFAYHKEKMLLCKQAEQGVPLQAEQYDWLADTDEEIGKQELEAHYSYIEKIQEVPTADTGIDFEPLEHVQNEAGYNVFANDLQHSEQSESVSNTCLVEMDDSNIIPDSPDMCNDDIQNDQNDVESVDERTEECKAILAETSKTLGESNIVRDSFLVTLQNKQTEFKKYKAFNDRTIDYDKLKLVREKHDELIKQSLLTKSYYEGLVKQKIKVITDLKLWEEHDIDKMLSMEKQLKLIPDWEETLALESESRSKLNKDLVRPYDYTTLNSLYENFKPPTQEFKIQLAHVNEIRKKIELKKLIEKGKGKSVKTKFDKPFVVRQPNAQRIPKPLVLGKPAPFSNSLERIYFSKTKSVPKTNVSEGLSKPVTAQTLPHTARQAIVQLIIFIVDSRCTKHMTGNLNLLCNFVEKFMGTVRFGNDQFAPILRYGDLVQGNIMINRVYYVEGLNHNLFSVGQFCDADLEVAFRKSTCYVRDLQGNDLLTGIPKLKYVKDQLCSSCELSKVKGSSFKSKVVPSSKGRLNFLHMDLCGPMRVASINGKKYILVIIDDYSRYTWTLFLRSKDETPEVLKEFLTMIQRNLQAPVITFRTDRGTEFLNKTLNAFF
nr:integrase, catalytic region, zinc finger, CCHC-type, peptidase aspartic, catalytic [Tanacetum cinerariifolium]